MGKDMESRITDFFTMILQISPEDITDDTTPENFDQWDSFKHMMLISSFEEEFDISIEPEEIIEMYNNFGAFKKVIITKLG